MAKLKSGLMAIATTSLAISAPAYAKPMEFSVQRDTTGTGEILASGDIGPGSAAALEQLIKTEGADGRLTSITLESEGGDLVAGIALGRVIRRHRLVSAIDMPDIETGHQPRCVSACAYAFLGGSSRAFSTSYGDDDPTMQTRLGFHSYAFDYTVPGQLRGNEVREIADDVAQDSQKVGGELADYVAEMGVSVDIIQRAAGYGRNSFLFLSVEELKKMKILTDYSAATGTFQLQVDGSRLQAVFTHDDHQFAFACHARPGGKLEPVVVFSQVYPQKPEQTFRPWGPPIKLSSILATPSLPWTARDLEHGHFHAHEWIPILDGNPVYGFMLARLFGPDSDSDSITLSPQNSDFRWNGDIMHAILTLPQDWAKEIKVSNDFHLSLSEWYYGESTWAHAFKDGKRDSENIAFALKDCT